MVSQITHGVRSFLGQPWIYRLVQDLLGARKARREYARSYVTALPGESVLDIGCGPGDILDFLPAVRYHGFDLSCAYIEAARRRYGTRGSFENRDVREIASQDLPMFDLILATSLLHHLEDDEVRHLFTTAAALLNPTGRLVTIDPTLMEGQHPLARWLIRQDRGQNVRGPEAYAGLARTVFPFVQVAVRHDLLNVPYSHAVLVCRHRNDGHCGPAEVHGVNVE